RTQIPKHQIISRSPGKYYPNTNTHPNPNPYVLVSPLQTQTPTPKLKPVRPSLAFAHRNTHPYGLPKNKFRIISIRAGHQAKATQTHTRTPTHTRTVLHQKNKNGTIDITTSELIWRYSRRVFNAETIWFLTVLGDRF